jgi:hypothetical protein
MERYQVLRLATVVAAWDEGQSTQRCQRGVISGAGVADDC